MAKKIKARLLNRDAACACAIWGLGTHVHGAYFSYVTLKRM